MTALHGPQRTLSANLGLAGPLAAVLFLASLLGFAAVRTDGYTHGTKAVSELGSFGAPSALAFNLLAFIIPGLLVVLLAVAVRRAVGPRLGWVGPTLVALSGLALAAAGVFPVDMVDEGSPISAAHFAGAILTGVFWSFSLFWVGPGLRTRPGFQGIGRLTPWFVLFPVANLLWQAAYGEYYFTPTLWPDFTPEELEQAIIDYQHRDIAGSSLAAQFYYRDFFTRFAPFDARGVSVRGLRYLGTSSWRSRSTIWNRKGSPATKPTMETNHGAPECAAMKASTESRPLMRAAYSMSVLAGSWWRSRKRIRVSCVHGSL